MLYFLFSSQHRAEENNEPAYRQAGRKGKAGSFNNEVRYLPKWEKIYW